MPDFAFYRSNAETSYPFEHVLPPLKGYFVDAYVVYRWVDPAADARNKRIKLSYFDPISSPKRITLVDEDNVAFVNLSSATSGVQFKTSVFGSYTIYEWRKVSSIAGAFTSDEVIIRAVVLTAAESSQSFPLTPTDAFLISSLVNHRMPRVRTLGVKQPDLTPLLGLDGGNFVLQAGNNVKFSIVTNDQPTGLGLPVAAQARTPTRVLVDIIPGAGTGRKQVCLDDSNPIRTINGVSPNAKGNLFLFGEDCIWVERPVDPASIAPAGGGNTKIDYTATVIPHTLKIRADCKACCDCVDYGFAYEVISGLWTRAKKAAKRIEIARAMYNDLVNQIRRIRAVTCPTPTVDQQVLQFLNVITRPDYHYAVAMSVLNNTGKTLDSILFSFSIDGAFEYTERSGFVNTPTLGQRQVDPVGSNPYSITIPQVKHGETAQYTFSGRYFHGQRAGKVYRVTGTVNTSAGTLTKTISGVLTKPLNLT